MKYEWRKRDQVLYLPQTTPCVVEVPEMTYLMVAGEGDPNGAAFLSAVKALYGLAYGLKTAPKKGLDIPQYYDYTVFPLEAFWDSKVPVVAGQPVAKQQLVYQAMLRQPDFMTAAVYEQVKALVANKVSAAWRARIERVTFDEGLNVQLLHQGAYDDAADSFAAIETFCDAQGLMRIGHGHKEVYLNNPQQVSAAELETVLRVPVRPMG